MLQSQAQSAMLISACMLVAGIALASNLGGMTSPISSPQNLFAIERMSMAGLPPSWLSWFAVALPVAFLGNFLVCGLLLLVYQDPHFTEVRPMQPIKVRVWIVPPDVMVVVQNHYAFVGFVRC